MEKTKKYGVGSMLMGSEESHLERVQRVLESNKVKEAKRVMDSVDRLKK